MERPLNPRRRIPPKAWIALLIWAGLVIALWPFDERVTAWVKGHRDAIGEWFPTALVLMGGVIGIQGIRSMPNGNRLLVGFLTPVIISTALTHLLKFAIGRSRPFLGDGPASYFPGIGGGDYASFPSGHTQYAFVIATIWVLHWPKLRWIAFLWAPAVGFERIWSEKHFLSDVLAGAAIGGFTAVACSALLGHAFYRLGWTPPQVGDVATRAPTDVVDSPSPSARP